LNIFLREVLFNVENLAYIYDVLCLKALDES
jgi:hypothetical protein